MIKKQLAIIICLAFLFAPSWAAQQTLNNGESGLVIRTKINENFTDLYGPIISTGTQTALDLKADIDDPTFTTGITTPTITIPQAVTAQNIVLLEGSGSGTDSYTIVAQPFAADRTLTLPDHDGAIPAATAIDSSGLILKAGLTTDSVDYTKTEGSYKASSLVGDPDTWDITPALHYGGFMIANADGEDELDAAVIDMNLSLSARDGISAIWNPNASDTIIRNGVALAQGEALISDSTAGVYSLATCVVVAANTWECSCSDGVTEETP